MGVGIVGCREGRVKRGSEGVNLYNVSAICFIYMKYAMLPLTHTHCQCLSLFIYILYFIDDKNKKGEQRSWNVKIPFALKWLNVTLFHAVLSRLSALFSRLFLFSFVLFFGIFIVELAPARCPSVKCISISPCAMLFALVLPINTPQIACQLFGNFIGPGDNGI